MPLSPDITDVVSTHGISMTKNCSEPRLEKDISIHIFSVSAAMVGVCLTVIGIIRIVLTIKYADTLADDLLAADAILFLIACILSYWALRTRNIKRLHRIENMADSVFILALSLMVVVCIFITYQIAVT